MQLMMMCMYMYVALCRCTELTRKDKLCENVRKMQHSKVMLSTSSQTCIHIKLTSATCIVNNQHAQSVLNLIPTLTVQLLDTWPTCLCDTSSSPALIQTDLAQCTLYFEKPKSSFPHFSDTLPSVCALIVLTCLVCWWFPPVATVGLQAFQHHSNHIHPARRC